MMMTVISGALSSYIVGRNITIFPFNNSIYLLIPWSRVLLEKLAGLHLVKKFPAFYGTRRFIYPIHNYPPPVSSLSQPNPVHTPTSHFLKIRLNIIPIYAWVSSVVSFSQVFPPKPCTRLSLPIRATCPAHLILDFITRTIVGEEYRSLSSSLCNFHHPPLPRPS
jgi:hypothetical protein